MKFSIIIPSYNQPRFIEQTLQNVVALKQEAKQHGYELEVLLFDACSNNETQVIIKKYEWLFDVLEISKDKGQADAINKGIERVTGAYWTWLNTDDLIDISGFLKMAGIVSQKPEIDYIYGDIAIIDENNQPIRKAVAYDLSLKKLIHKNPAIFQPGSFISTAITKKIGNLNSDYHTSFDYEYALRLLSNNSVVYRCNFTLARFRYYTASKSGAMVPVFIREQLRISKKYGRKNYSIMTLFFQIRLLKHRFFSR